MFATSVQTAMHHLMGGTVPYLYCIHMFCYIRVCFRGVLVVPMSSSLVGWLSLNLVVSSWKLCCAIWSLSLVSSVYLLRNKNKVNDVLFPPLRFVLLRSCSFYTTNTGILCVQCDTAHSRHVIHQDDRKHTIRGLRLLCDIVADRNIFSSWGTTGLERLGGQEPLPKLVHLCWQVMMPALEVVACVLPQLSKLAKSSVPIRDLLGLHQKPILLEGVLQLLFYQRPLARLPQSTDTATTVLLKFERRLNTGASTCGTTTPAVLEDSHQCRPGIGHIFGRVAWPELLVLRLHSRVQGITKGELRR